MEDTISIEYQGKKYQGKREITGTRILYQTISYGSKTKADAHPYKPNEKTYMKNIAEVMLRELVQESENNG